MPIRITGMNSGLDTESIISELVKAQKAKTENVKKKQTSLQWKQDAWKELNSKIYKLFNGTLSNMRFATDYSKKTTDVSDSSVASIITGDSAMNTSQTLEVSKLATSGYLAGAGIGVDADGKVVTDLTNSSKLTEMGVAEGSVISITTGGKTTDITITADMTFGSFTKKLQEAGVEASFDEKYQRFHIAAKKSGALNDFTITAGNSSGTDALSKLGIFAWDESSKAEYEKYINMTDAEKTAWKDAETQRRLNSYIGQRKSLLETKTKQEEAVAESKEAFRTEFKDKYGDTVDIDDLLADANYKTNLQSEIDTLKANIESAGDSATQEDKDKLAKLQGEMSAVENYEKKKDELAATNTSITDVEQYMTISGDSITASDLLKTDVDAFLQEKIDTAADIVANPPTGVTKKSGQDAEIILNGITYKSDSNTFEVNGLTITALKETTGPVTLTTRQDTDGIYDNIKNFLKEYNALINEMDKLFNSESTKGYNPLSDDEKAEMSDSEVEKWEKKIKDSILRRDSGLSTVSSAMKNIMLQGAEVNGERMYLSDFGIETLGWFTSEENEKNAYHINGDADDSAVSSKENTLKAAIAADPEKVAAFFSELSNNLYTELSNQSKGIEGVRTFGKFYDDKRMQEEYNSYAEKIKRQEQKLTAMEDRWYNKFAAMETALARLQSNQSAISGLFGGM